MEKFPLQKTERCISSTGVVSKTTSAVIPVAQRRVVHTSLGTNNYHSIIQTQAQQKQCKRIVHLTVFDNDEANSSLLKNAHSKFNKIFGEANDIIQLFSQDHSYIYDDYICWLEII